MIAVFKAASVAAVAGITSLLAMCVTTGTVRAVHHHYSPHSHTKHRKIVHEYYLSSPTPAIPSPPPASMSVTIIPEVSTQTKPVPSPVYKTSIHKNPPWSPNYKPDQ